MLPLISFKVMLFDGFDLTKNTAKIISLLPFLSLLYIYYYNVSWKENQVKILVKVKFFVKIKNYRDKVSIKNFYMYSLLR